MPHEQRECDAERVRDHRAAGKFERAGNYRGGARFVCRGLRGVSRCVRQRARHNATQVRIEGCGFYRPRANAIARAAISVLARQRRRTRRAVSRARFDYAGVEISIERRATLAIGRVCANVGAMKIKEGR